MTINKGDQVRVHDTYHSYTPANPVGTVTDIVGDEYYVRVDGSDHVYHGHQLKKMEVEVGSYVMIDGRIDQVIGVHGVREPKTIELRDYEYACRAEDLTLLPTYEELYHENKRLRGRR